MFRETAKVISVVSQGDGQHVWLSPTNSTQCAQCSVNSSCGQGLLTNYSSNNHIPLQVINKTDARFNYGDQVFLEINESSIMGLSFLFYLLPLTLMMIFMLVAVTMEFTEPWIIFATALGFVSGISALKGACRHNYFKSSHQPNIIVQ